MKSIAIIMGSDSDLPLARAAEQHEGLRAERFAFVRR